VGAAGPVPPNVTQKWAALRARGTSEAAFRRGVGFAYLWPSGRWLRNPTGKVVLSIALPRRDLSPRFKEVAHPAKRVWMHHLEVHRVEDLDHEVQARLREAYDSSV
jgi:hypothetical protein